MSQPIISVAICTYNRANRLPFVLDSLISQTLPLEKFEILLVNNASTDGTQEIALSYQQKLSNLHVIYEPVQGLSRARNTALARARGQYIAYVDDDAIPVPDWLTQILETFETVQPQPVCVGGPIYPLWEIPKPDWIHPYMENLYSALDCGDQPHWFEHPFFPYGTNMIYRRDAIAQVGGFSEDLGRQGYSLLSEEESLLNQLLKSQGGQFYYNPLVSVQHWVPKERINPQWIINRMFWQGRSVAIVEHLLGKPLSQQRLKGARTLFSIANLKRMGAQAFPDRKVRIRTWGWLMRDLGYFYQTYLGMR